MRKPRAHGCKEYETEAVFTELKHERNLIGQSECAMSFPFSGSTSCNPVLLRHHLGKSKCQKLYNILIPQIF